MDPLAVASALGKPDFALCHQPLKVSLLTGFPQMWGKIKGWGFSVDLAP